MDEPHFELVADRGLYPELHALQYVVRVIGHGLGLSALAVDVVFSRADTPDLRNAPERCEFRIIPAGETLASCLACGVSKLASKNARPTLDLADEAELFTETLRIVSTFARRR
jgi:hypothetical protein